MTTNGIDTVLGIYDALARQDLATLLAVTDPDVTITQTDALPWGGEYRGAAGLKEFLARLLQHVRSAVEVRECFAAGSQVVVVGRTAGEVRATGASFDVRVVHVWTLHGGKVTRFEPFLDTPIMLRALDTS